MDNQSFSPAYWRPNEKISPAKLNQTIDVIRKQSRGINAPKQILAPIVAAQAIPDQIDWLLTDSTVALSGVPSSIDNGTPASGDFCLVLLNNTLDGIYTIAAGAWQRLCQLRASDTPTVTNRGTSSISGQTTIPTIDLGTPLYIFNGASAGLMVIVGQDTFSVGGAAAALTPAFIPMPMTRRFKIASVAGNYLVCNPYAVDGTVITSQSINIARPYELQTSLAAWNGLTFSYTDNQSRSATDGTNTEPQVIVPAYVVGDQIMAECMPHGGTGVTDSSGKKVNWMDSNRGGRAWAKQQDALTQTQPDVSS